jgi:catechol 2,3-dioxygenase-like lactoylglutathione lyase family enzyme
MRLVQARLVTDDVEALAAFYARLVAAHVTLNDYYVEVPALPATIGFSKRRFTEYREDDAARPGSPHDAPVPISRSPMSTRNTSGVASLGVEWVMPPTTQPWGNRSMIFRDPDGNLVNVFSRPPAAR